MKDDLRFFGCLFLVAAIPVTIAVLWFGLSGGGVQGFPIIPVFWF